MPVREHVRQRFDFDCGRACVAMRCGVTYERVVESTAPDVPRKGMSYGEIIGAIWKITGRFDRLTIREKPESLRAYLKRVRVRGPQIILCERPEVANPLWSAHYFVTDETEAVYDPLRAGPVAPAEVAQSAQGNWMVVGLIYEV